MLDFARTRAQLDLRDVVRTFASVELTPHVAQADRDRQLPGDLNARFHETEVPHRFFRHGGPYLSDACMVTEELGYACAAGASFLMLPVFFNRFLLRVLDESAAETFRRELACGPVITAFAASERQAGSDLHAISVVATRTPTGFRLNGRKEYSTNARHARQVIVVARVEGDAVGSSSGLSWLLVPMGSEGITLGPRWETLGLRALDVSPIEFRDVSLPASALLGSEGGGLHLMNQNLAQSRTGIAALAVGIARRARDLVLEFAKTRRLYGDRLSRLQDYRFHIAEMEADISAARALVAASAEKYDRGLEHNKDASIAKLYAGRMVMRVTERASEMLGSIGFTGQSPVEKLFRDARHVAIVEGPEPIHREIIFAEMLRRGAA